MEFNSKQIKIVIGLGNADKQYNNTYHNVGFLAVDFLQNKIAIPTAKNNSYMNVSGADVAKAMKNHNAKPEETIITHDDSDLTIGNYKLSFGSGAAGHHGVESIQANLKTNDFWRLRIGIRPTSETVRQKAEEFVLKKISSADKKILESVFEKISKELLK